MLEINTSQQTDPKSLYRDYIKNFSFTKQGEIQTKTNHVFFKILIISLYLCICGISSNYIFSVFFLKEVSTFPNYFMNFVQGLNFWIGLVILGFITTSLRICIKKLFIYSYFSPIRSKARCDKLFLAAAHFPELRKLLSKRIKERGFISEMDYNNLCIEKICKEI